MKQDRESVKLLGRKYAYEDTLETNISTDYVDENTSSAWGEWELVRECMQNIMDEADHAAQSNGGHLSDHLEICTVDYARGDTPWWYLRDKGRGADVANILYLGLSGKRGQGRRGEKGEGQLLAFLVAARKDIAVIFASQDYLLIPRVSNGNSHPHLVLDLYRARTPIKGTRIFIERTTLVDHYVERRRDYFPDLVKPRARGSERSPSKRKMFEPKDGEPKLYLKGIFVRDIDALFSYNLSKSRISRDRDLVSEEDLVDELAEIWSEVVNYRQIKVLLNQATHWSPSALEMRISLFDLDKPQKVAWRKAFRELAGCARSVLWTNDLIAREARRKGYVVCRIEQQSVFDALVRAGVKRDCDVAKQADPYKELAPIKREVALFEALEEVATLCQWGNSRKLKVFKSTGVDSEYDNRLAFQRGDYLYFKRSHIEGSAFGDLLHTFVHEETHRQFNAPDESREFEDGQGKLWFDVVKYASPYVNKQLVAWNTQ